jgi:putative acetyltransferase
MPHESIALEPLSSPDARALILALNADILERYPNPEDNFFELSEDEVTEGNGAFVVARLDSVPVGCGAFRRTDARTAEIKRMYVARAARGHGLGRRILEALESEARRLSIERLVLETGERQHEAVALYERAGFRRIPRFGPYAESEHSICFEKLLDK